MSSEEEIYKKRGILECKGEKYEVEFYVENNDTLIIQVENCHTQNQWLGKYDSSYIEELSHKTGNFKQFDIFCSMLESSLLSNSESVMLDILSYEDLKVLREQKLGTKSRKPKEKTDKLQTKRYLIMTYTVEFDQIHYPLPLTYTGSSSNTVTSKNKIQDEETNITETENSRYTNKGGISRAEFNRLLNENKELKAELNECRKYMKEIGGGAFAKELKVLKKVIQNLETDLLRERNKHHHTIAKKKKEHEKLILEFEDLKASERNYRVRCENLTEELAMLKRESRSGMKPQRYRSTGSALKNRNRSQERGRSLSNSREVFTKRSSSHERSRERSDSASSLRRTPSPGFKRFDPSAYIKEREKKRKETEINRSGGIKTPSSSSKRDKTPVSFNRLTKPPSAGSKGRNSNIRTGNRKNRSSSMGSDTDSIIRLNVKKRHSSERCPSRIQRRSDTSGDECYEKRNYPRSKVKSALKKDKPSPAKSYRNAKDAVSEHAIGIAEIDARLEALQKFMQDNID